MSVEPVAAWAQLVPSLTSLPNAPKRIICHWTGGGPKANDVDKAHYHFIVEQDGNVVRGVHPVAENMRKLGRGTAYAGHTGGFNSFSVGVSFAGMASWVPGGTTKYPLTAVQVQTGMTFVAFLGQAYGLDPLNSSHVFTHTEAWTLHKVKGTVNDQKTDITYLPFKPDLGKAAVGPWLRQVAFDALRSLSTPAKT